MKKEMDFEAADFPKTGILKTKVPRDKKQKESSGCIQNMEISKQKQNTNPVLSPAEKKTGILYGNQMESPS